MSRKSEPIGTITVNYSDGSSRDVAIQPPGAAIRFALGAAEAHAMIWRMWTGSTTRDIYLSVRDGRNGGNSKYSFHASGDWRLQYEYSEAIKRGVPRVLDRWEQPAVDSDGLIFVTRILTPSDDIVVNVKPEKDAAKIDWITPAPSGMLNGLAILMAPPASQPSLPANAYLVAAMSMADGSLVFVFHSASEIQPHEEDIFARIRQEAARNPPPGSPATYVPRADPEYRCQVNAHEGEEKGPHSIWDLLM